MRNLMLIAFAIGAAVRAFEEWLRREHRELALTDQFNREDSRRLERLLAASPLYERWMMLVLLFVSPRTMVARLRRRLGQANEEQFKGK